MVNMVLLKLLTLAFAASAAASTFYAAPPDVSPSASESVIVVNITSTTSVAAKGPDSAPTTMPWVVGPLPAHSTARVMTLTPLHSTSPLAPVEPGSSGDGFHLSSWEPSQTGNHLTTSTLSELPVHSTVAPSVGTASTMVVTSLSISSNSTLLIHSPSISAPAPPTQTVNSAGATTLGAGMGLMAFVLGVLGA
ncbi:hypothetical protein ACEQ8H_005915 [Pleosporales sp. CAS-2024a]